MSPRHRVGFLPVFFVTLAVVFAIAVFLRIRSYSTQPTTATATESSAEAATAPLTASDAPEPERETTGVIVETETRNSTTALSATSDYSRGLGPGVLNPAASSTPAPPPAAAPATAATQPAVTATAPARAPFSANAPPRSATITPVKTASASAPPDAPQPATPQPPQTQTTEPPNSDPTSDTAPPQLISAEFNPPQIRDGETTILTVVANDALSGIRSISGIIVAPTRTVQGFACQREGETNRFSARINVPKDAAEGVWLVNQMSILDNANNVATLSPRTGLPPSASFTVSSVEPDKTGPTLRSVFIDKRAMRGGEKNVLFVEAEDDKSGVNVISGVFQSPSRSARVGFVCRGAGTGRYECDLAVPNCADCGIWNLEQLQLQDKANNMTTVRPDNAMVGAIRVDVSSTSCDATPPELLRVSLDRNSIGNAAPGSITISASLGDDACGVLSVSGHATGPSPTGAPLHFFLSATSDGGNWSGKINIPALLAKGEWRVVRMQVLDKGQNLRSYSASDPVLAGATFTVQ